MLRVRVAMPISASILSLWAALALDLRAYVGPLAVDEAPLAVTPAPVDAPATVDPRAALFAMEASYAKVRDYTATFHKQERVKGKLLPREVIQVKFRRPYSLYMKWTGGERKAQEVIYVRGKNEGKLRAHPGSFPDVTVNLEPSGSLAMKGNRHPITEASLGDIVALIVRDLRRSEGRPQDRVQLRDLAESERHGARVRCFDARFPAGYYGEHIELCLFVASNLPSRVRVWTANELLLEDYEYRDLRVNVGLRDLDFDAGNPRYDF